MLRLTRHVRMMAQVEALFRSRLMPGTLQNLLLQSITVIDKNKYCITINPNHSNGLADSLFLLLVRTMGGRRVFVQLFEAVVSGFIPPDPQPDIPRKLVANILDVALREHELDKWEKRLHIRAASQGLPTTQPRSILQTSQLPPPPSPTLLTRCPSLSRIMPGGQRASWVRTFMPDTDWEDEASDTFHNNLPNWQSYHSLPGHIRPVIHQDTSARLEELRIQIVNLQATIGTLLHSVQQHHIHPHLSQTYTQSQVFSPVSSQTAVPPATQQHLV